MEFRGWNGSPSGFQSEFNFIFGPKWLLLLSLTPYFERYAYPIAIDRGLAELWPITADQNLDSSFNSNGWLVHSKPKGELEKWIEGSLAIFQPSLRNSVARFFHKDRTWHLSSKIVIIWHVVPRVALTRYGAKLRLRHDIHRMNGTYHQYKRALVGLKLNFSE